MLGQDCDQIMAGIGDSFVFFDNGKFVLSLVIEKKVHVQRTVTGNVSRKQNRNPAFRRNPAGRILVKGIQIIHTHSGILEKGGHIRKFIQSGLGYHRAVACQNAQGILEHRKGQLE